MNHPLAVAKKMLVPGMLWDTGYGALEIGEVIRPGEMMMVDPATGKVVRLRGESAMPSDKTEKKTRTSKSAAQKAQEALDVSTRKLDRLYNRVNVLEADLDQVRKEIKVQEKEHDYLAQNPHLSPVQNSLAKGDTDDDPMIGDKA